MTDQYRKLEEETRKLIDPGSSSKQPRHRKRSIGRMLLALLVLVVAGWLLLHYIVHIVAFLAGIIVVVAAVIAVIWAVRVLV